MVLVGPRPSAGSRTAMPRRAPTRAAPAPSTSRRAPSREEVLIRRSVSSCRVVRSETQEASRSWIRTPGGRAASEGEAAGGTPGRGAVVCGGAGTVESIPATFGRRGALMSVGFPTGAFDAIASQTPCHPAPLDVPTCTRTRGAMSSIVPTGKVVSMRSCERVEVSGKLAENYPRCAPFAVDWRRLKARHSERAGYVDGDRQGQLRSPRNVMRDPGVFHAAGRGPPPTGGERVLNRSGSDLAPSGSTWLHRDVHGFSGPAGPAPRGPALRRPGTR